MGIQRSKYLIVEDDVTRLKQTYHVLKNQKKDEDKKKDDENEMIERKELIMRFCLPQEVN